MSSSQLCASDLPLYFLHQRLCAERLDVAGASFAARLIVTSRSIKSWTPPHLETDFLCAHTIFSSEIILMLWPLSVLFIFLVGLPTVNSLPEAVKFLKPLALTVSPPEAATSSSLSRPDHFSLRTPSFPPTYLQINPVSVSAPGS